MTEKTTENNTQTHNHEQVLTHLLTSLNHTFAGLDATMKAIDTNQKQQFEEMGKTFAGIQATLKEIHVDNDEREIIRQREIE